MKHIEPTPLLLTNKIMHYSWGTKGKNAFIPSFTGIIAKEDLPYAEIWMGAHPKAPSTIHLDNSQITLPDLISYYPEEILGSSNKTFKGKFPFLVKILSIDDTLSIQAHPNKKQAKILHAKETTLYPDTNHKPEIVIALDSLTCFIGLKSMDGIKGALENYPEIKSLISDDVLKKLYGAPDILEQQDLPLKAYSSLLINKKPVETIVFSINQLTERLLNKGTALLEEEKIFLRLKGRYPEDISLFSVFLLNLVKLQKYQAAYIAPGIPHAYVKGNAVECMATSDNVVRGGLTNKHVDINTFIDILDNNAKPLFFTSDTTSANFLYNTPTKEFQVGRNTINSGTKKTITTNNTPCILLVMKGKIKLEWDNEGLEDCTIFQQGQAVLIPAFLKKVSMSSLEDAELFYVIIPN